MRLPKLWLVTLLLSAQASGCRITLESSSVGSDQGPSDGGLRATDAGETLEAGPVTPDSGSPVRDAAEDDETTAPPVRHRKCFVARPKRPAQTPDPDWTPNGRPSFDLWRDVAESEARSYPTCDEGTTHSIPTCDACANAFAPEEALCTSYTGSPCILMDVLFGDSRCPACVTPAAKARACLDNFHVDCRPWPFAMDTPIGGICAAHDDCEPGLVCTPAANVASWPYRVNTCECPESNENTAPARCGVP